MVLNYYYTLLTDEDKKEISSICENINIYFNPHKLVTTNASIDMLVDGIVAFFTRDEMTALLNGVNGIQLLVKLLEKMKRISIKKQSEKINIWNNHKINVSFKVENGTILFPDNFDNINPDYYVFTSSFLAQETAKKSQEPFVVSLKEEEIVVECEEEFINYYSTKGQSPKEIFDYNKLAEAIVKAQQKADKIEKEKLIVEEKKKHTELMEKRKEVLGEKDFSYIDNKIWRKIREFFNAIKVIIKILFLNKENMKYFSAVDSLIKTVTIGGIMIIRFILYVMSIIIFVCAFCGADIIPCISTAIAVFMFAQLFRIAENEIDLITNKEYVVAVCAIVITALSLIIPWMYKTTIADLFVIFKDTFTI